MTPKPKPKQPKDRPGKPERREPPPPAAPPTATSGSSDLGRVEPRAIEIEMQQSYLDYAMSVIVARALPDVRDGLKPVHRRILYAMGELGLRANAKYRKSALVVGEVLGKFHPHGDTAVYDSLVRMAQPFAMRVPLVDGQGNFGSLDGDTAAAMRYTEARLTRVAEEMLQDIDKDSVDFVPNYDGSQKEPTVLPARVPNLLLNGTVGIAVGMSTSIPPHNLGELCAATALLIDNPHASVDDLLTVMPGPDFPTGGTVYGASDIKAVYATGKGAIVTRAKAEIVEGKSGFQILVTEIPYQVNKATLVERIADLVREKKIDGIKDLRDESNKEGVRIVIELKKDSYPKKVLNRLYTTTSLQETFHVNMLALVDGIQPRVLTLKMVLEEFLKHRQVVVRRRTAFELEQVKKRLHILKGFLIALGSLDAVIRTIKNSEDRDDAKRNLVQKFKLSEIQADAILEMKLSQLAHLERQRIEQEYKDKVKLEKELESILASPKKILGIIKTELSALKTRYGVARLTTVNRQPVGEFKQEDLIPKEPTVIVVTRDGYIKRLPPDTFKTQGRGGKGVIGLTTKEEDTVEHFFATNTHADLLFFTTSGRVFQLKAYDVPAASRTAKGQAIANFLELPPSEKVSSVLSMSEVGSAKFLVMVTRNGVIKKVELNAFENVRRAGLIAIRLKPGDVLEWVKPSTGKDDIALVSREGQSIRFREGDVRDMGRAAAGVRGMRLRKGDAVVGMDIIPNGQSKGLLFTVSTLGYGKRTPLSQYKVQGRGGSGIKTADVTTKTGPLVSAMVVTEAVEATDFIIISDKGQVIRLPVKSVSTLGRATQGVRLMRFKEPKDEVANVTLL
jgi:DNA gyrase subunit A